MMTMTKMTTTMITTMTMTTTTKKKTMMMSMTTVMMNYSYDFCLYGPFNCILSVSYTHLTLPTKLSV